MNSALILLEIQNHIYKYSESEKEYVFIVEGERPIMKEPLTTIKDINIEQVKQADSFLQSNGWKRLYPLMMNNLTDSETGVWNLLLY